MLRLFSRTKKWFLFPTVFLLGIIYGTSTCLTPPNSTCICNISNYTYYICVCLRNRNVFTAQKLRQLRRARYKFVVNVKCSISHRYLYKSKIYPFCATKRTWGYNFMSFLVRMKCFSRVNRLYQDSIENYNLSITFFVIFVTANKLLKTLNML